MPGELWVYITPNANGMKIQYTIPCETCLVGEVYAAVEGEVFTTFSKEELEAFVVLAKIKWTQIL